MTLSQTQIQHIIMYRGLGYNQQEVADKINYSRSTVAYYLHKLKTESKENGIDETFWSYFSTDDLYNEAFKKGKYDGY